MLLLLCATTFSVKSSTKYLFEVLLITILTNEEGWVLKQMPCQKQSYNNSKNHKKWHAIFFRIMHYHGFSSIPVIGYTSMHIAPEVQQLTTLLNVIFLIILNDLKPYIYIYIYTTYNIKQKCNVL